MDAEIIATGTELLLGETLDTNSSYLASKLPSVGIRVRKVTLVDDNVKNLKEALERAWERSDFIFTTGGLGPTKDDVTRDAIAKVVREKIFIDEELLSTLKGIFKRRGSSMPTHNMKQAELIPSAIGLLNKIGTAPGWWVEKDGRTIIALPGPPRELQHMWENNVQPRIQNVNTNHVVVTRTLKTIGLSEATVDEMANGILGGSNPYTGIYAKSDGIHLRTIANAASTNDAWAMINPIEKNLRKIFTGYIWGIDSETPHQRVGEILQKYGMTMATMESCTGGLLASTITDIPGSSQYFKGGIVSYTNDLKTASGVDPLVIKKYGPISEQVAEAMATVVRIRLDSDFGIGITGVAGLTSLESIKPGTVYIGVSSRKRQYSRLHNFPSNDRKLIKTRSVVSALLMLHELIEGTEG